MELAFALTHLGLTTKQADVYLALLQAGSASVAQLSKRATTKRPTTYLILEELRAKGLATITPGRRIIYTAESPERLAEDERRRSDLLKAKIPELVALYNSKKEKPKIRYYQGNEALIVLYREIFQSKTLDIFGSMTASEPAILKAIWSYFEKFVAEKKLVRNLVPHDVASIDFAKRYTLEFYQIKIVPRETELPTDNIIFENKIAIFSHKDTPHAVVIESDDVATTYRSLFNLAWSFLS
jgi:sugar-specific transcriptional regulator TrmB